MSTMTTCQTTNRYLKFNWLPIVALTMQPCDMTTELFMMSYIAFILAAAGLQNKQFTLKPLIKDAPRYAITALITQM